MSQVLYFPSYDESEQWFVVVRIIEGSLALVLYLLLIISISNSKTKEVQTLHNYALCMLSAVDFMVGLLITVTNVWTVILGRFPGPATYVDFKGYKFWKGPVCSVQGFFAHFLNTWSGLTVSLIVWERYNKIARPLTTSPVTVQQMLAYFFVIGFICLLYALEAFVEGGYVLTPTFAECMGTQILCGTSILTCLFSVAGLQVTQFCYLKMFMRMKRVTARVPAWRRQYLSDEDRAIWNEEKRVAVGFIAIAVTLTLSFGGEFSIWLLAVFSFCYQQTLEFARNLNNVSHVLMLLSPVLNPILFMVVSSRIRCAVVDQLHNFFSAFICFARRFFRVPTNKNKVLPLNYTEAAVAPANRRSLVPVSYGNSDKSEAANV